MCGIAGAFGPAPLDEGRARATLARMHHRGPDASGQWRKPSGHDPSGRAHLTLLHTRLSIIDLDERAHQPFVRQGPGGTRALIFNGELYNHVELRQRLQAEGHTFETTSDTEVVLTAWAAWGPACLDAFEGMWAFALYDGPTGRLHLCRDRFGEKPLFWCWHEGTLYFASEVKALSEISGQRFAPSTEQIRRFFTLGYKALYKRPRTWFEGVHQLPAATLATLVEPGPPRPEPYWRLEYRPQPMSMEEALEGARSRLFEAVKLRLRADVPVAFCLSGGIDSGTLASVAVKRFGHQVHGFSIIDDDPRYDERENIEAVVRDLGVDHHIIRPDRSRFLPTLRKRVAQHDAPVVTLNYYMSAFMLEAIHEAGFKVALSGTGADELFTGYYDHYSFWLAEMSKRPGFEARVAEWRESYGAFVRNPLLQDPLAFVKCPEARDHIHLNADAFSAYLHEPFHEPFEERHFCDLLLRNRMLNELFCEAVPVILAEEDLNAMATSVENRAPYLDRHLAEWLFQVPPEHLIHEGFAKWLLRASGEGLLTDQVRLDKRKRGFNLAIDSLLDRHDPEVKEALLSESPIFDLVRREAIEDVLQRETMPNSFSKFLFSFVSVKCFLDG